VNEGFKGCSYRKNTMSELKAVLQLKDDDATDTQLQQRQRDPALARSVLM